MTESTAQKKWWLLSLKYQGALPIDEFAGLLMSYGLQAVNIRAENLEIFLEATQSEAESLIKILPLNECLEINLSHVTETNWVQNCAELFEPVQIDELTVIPITDAGARPAGEISKHMIYLIPGMGFGSGHHPTTQMIIRMMQGEAIKRTEIKTVLDCGTGSGILSLAAANLYEAKITACDNDPQAIINAGENFALNNLKEFIKLKTSSVEDISEKYDLIVCNLYLELLKKFKLHLLNLLAPGGHLIISGITKDQSEEIISEFSCFDMISYSELDNWSAIHYKGKIT